MINLEIILQALLVLVAQLNFIGFRTENIKAIANNNVKDALLTGFLVAISWQISVGLGSVSLYYIFVSGEHYRWPVPLASIIGGLIGTYISMKRKKDKV